MILQFYRDAVTEKRSFLYDYRVVHRAGIGGD